MQERPGLERDFCGAAIAERRLNARRAVRVVDDYTAESDTLSAAAVVAVTLGAYQPADFNEDGVGGSDDFRRWRRGDKYAYRRHGRGRRRQP